MKLIFKITKRIVLSFALLYSFNLLVSSYNLNVAVNIYSLLMVSILGIPGMIALLSLKLLL